MCMDAFIGCAKISIVCKNGDQNVHVCMWACTVKIVESLVRVYVHIAVCDIK